MTFSIELTRNREERPIHYYYNTLFHSKDALCPQCHSCPSILHILLNTPTKDPKSYFAQKVEKVLRILLKEESLLQDGTHVYFLMHESNEPCWGMECVCLSPNAIPSPKPFCIEIRSFPIPILLISSLQPPPSLSPTDHFFLSFWASGKLNKY
jgi:hypothetical protein